MAQVTKATLTTDWTALSDVMTVEENVSYYIQNRSPYNIIACESSSEPTTEEGILVLPYRVLFYEKGTQNLYLRTLENTALINISSEG